VSVQGIYTQLGVCYCKYKEEKVYEHIKMFWQKLNIPTLLRECQKNLLWPECVFLFTHYDQFDNAIDVMIDHSPQAWEHKLFKEVLNQVPNHEYYYRAIDFYLAEHPMLLNDLLAELKVDHSRVVNKLKGHLPLIEKYLLSVQRDNLHAYVARLFCSPLLCACSFWLSTHSLRCCVLHGEV
jgi:clathrin heavy chain